MKENVKRKLSEYSQPPLPLMLVLNKEMTQLQLYMSSLYVANSALIKNLELFRLMMILTKARCKIKSPV